MILCADFETVVNDPTEVWLSGFCDIDKPLMYDNVHVQYNIKDFFISLYDYIDKANVSDDVIVFFHNLKFDGSFILNYLIDNNFPFEPFINNMGVWYSVTIDFGDFRVIFRDSYKILNCGLRAMAKMLEMDYQKGDTPLLTKKPEQVSPEHLDYLYRDVLILGKGMFLMYRERKVTKFTNASESLKRFKKTIEFDKFYPILSKEVDAYIRPAYRGGFVQVKESIAGKLINQVIDVYDVTSLYPSITLDYPLPYGEPIFGTGKPDIKQNKFYVMKVMLNIKLINNHIPTLQTKDMKTLLSLGIRKSDFIKHTDDMLYEFTITNYDLDLILLHYHIIDIEYISYYEFKTIKGLFNKYMLYYKNKKETAKDPATRADAKNSLNGLTGKFGARPTQIKKKVYKQNGVLKFEPEPPEEVDTIYLPVVMAICALGRKKVITDAQNNYKYWLYSDTDSNHFIHSDNIIIDTHPTEFGKYKHESVCARGKYLRQKLYAEDIVLSLNDKFYSDFNNSDIQTKEEFLSKCENKSIYYSEYLGYDFVIDDVKFITKLDVKGAGMTPEVKKQVNFKNFKIGATFPGKRMSKQVRGGVLIYEGTFTINERDGIF